MAATTAAYGDQLEYGPSFSNNTIKTTEHFSCGGQMTADGSRCQNGGGILWNIIKHENQKPTKR
ncbi:hypothetical protein CFP56_011708 [Quercus suber]|uniref:Phosphorylated adapter RNA export protein RNA-binding domain-containing protein n=1 Tax=Quercus suber TaxID=58331 RepID=A0AAW0KZE5_QUESU